MINFILNLSTNYYITCSARQWVNVFSFLFLTIRLNNKTTIYLITIKILFEILVHFCDTN